MLEITENITSLVFNKNLVFKKILTKTKTLGKKKS